METSLRILPKNAFLGPLNGNCQHEMTELAISASEITLLEKKAQGIKRAKSVNVPPQGRKLCATRHGCQGATDCNYCYGDYPG